MRRFILGLIVLLSVGCGCISPAAYTAIDRGISSNLGHMNDTGLPKEAVEIATDNYDVFNQVKFNLNGTPLPADTAKRSAARKAAEAAAVSSSTGGDE